MATNAQIVVARATQTQGVWNLAPTFAFGGITKTDHAGQLTAVNDAIAAMDTAEGPFDAATAAVAAEHAFFKSMNVALGQRLDSEVANDSPLQNRGGRGG